MPGVHMDQKSGMSKDPMHAYWPTSGGGSACFNQARWEGWDGGRVGSGVVSWHDFVVNLWSHGKIWWLEPNAETHGQTRKQSYMGGKCRLSDKSFDICFTEALGLVFWWEFQVRVMTRLVIALLQSFQLFVLFWQLCENWVLRGSEKSDLKTFLFKNRLSEFSVVFSNSGFATVIFSWTSRRPTKMLPTCPHWLMPSWL